MNVKKISAPTMTEVMKKVKNELGENAVILNSKVVYKGGFLGLFRKKNVEVIAAVDEPIHTNQPIIGRERPFYYSNNSYLYNMKENEILAEIKALKREVVSLKERELQLEQYPKLIQTVLLNLNKTGLAEEYIIKIGDRLLEKWRNSWNKPTQNDVNNWCRELLIEDLPTEKFKEPPLHKKFINFVGPTGVGKTTTIAKLAAQAVLKENKKVAFITTDTYRIAAIDQLKTYAELLQVPLEIIYEDKDFSIAIEKFRNYDLVFIDTAGRNYRDKKYIDDLKKLFGKKNPIHTYLVLSLSMKEEDMFTVAENFLDFHFDQFIFSKADETATFGIMYNLMTTYQTGAGYITNGQDVPDDILQATPEKIVDYLMGTETL